MAFPISSRIAATVFVSAATAFGSFATADGAEPAVKHNVFSEGRSLKVVIDRAKVVRIAKPADTIIIGNPAIVDATIQDAQTLVLTGRTFGITNLIVLDADGDVVVDETIVVQGHETNMVRIYRQASRETLTCSPVCESSVMIGDDADKFNAVRGQISARESFAQGN